MELCTEPVSGLTNLVASQSLDNERVVVNLRHLTEMLSQQSEYYQGRKNSITGICASFSHLQVRTAKKNASCLGIMGAADDHSCLQRAGI